MNFCDSCSAVDPIQNTWENSVKISSILLPQQRLNTDADKTGPNEWKCCHFLVHKKNSLPNESLIQLVSPPMRLSDLWEFHYTTLGYGHLNPYTNTFVNPKQYMYGRHDALSEQGNRIQQDPTSFNAFRSLLWKCWTEELWYNFYGTRGFHKARFWHTARSKVLSHDRTRLFPSTWSTYSSPCHRFSVGSLKAPLQGPS